MIPTAVFESVLGAFLAPVRAYLDDPSVTEVLINGPSKVYIERAGRLERVPTVFASSQRVVSALRVVAQYTGRAFDELHPILEAHLPDGSRLEAILPPLVADGPSVAIRRFSKTPLTLSKLLRSGSLSQSAADTLRVLVESKRNIVVAGGTGSGKTSLLNALSALIPDGERVIVLEDAKELQLQREHVVQLQSRPADAQGRGAVGIRALLKASLRMRPDRLVLGEIRAGESLDLIQAMTSGHGGCLTTVHATYPTDTLHRLETMALMAGIEIPLYALRAQLASAIDIIVQTARHRDGSRGVTHITEVRGVEPNLGYQLQDIFALDLRLLAAGSHVLVPTGELPRCLQAIVAQEFKLPEEVYQAHRQRHADAMMDSAHVQA